MKYPVIILLTVLSTACGDNDDGLLGAWQTQACESIGAFGGVSEVWARGIYVFIESGTLLYDAYVYTDSQCIGELSVDRSRAVRIAPSGGRPARSGVETITASFVDLGPAQLQEGILGRELEITLSAGDDSFALQGFYVINDGVLCFSDKFIFEATVFGLNEAGSDAIDFEHCLVGHEI